MKSYKEVVNEVNDQINTPAKFNLVSIISKQFDLPIYTVKEQIRGSALTIGTKVVHYMELVPRHNRIVLKFQNRLVKLPIQVQSKLDVFINVLKAELGFSNTDNILPNNKLLFSAYVLEFIEQADFDVNELTENKFSEIIWSTLETFYREKFQEGNENKVPKRKELINNLLEHKEIIFKEFDRILISLENNLYDLNKNRVFQDFSKLFSTKSFKSLLLPLVGQELDFVKIVHSLINVYKSVANCEKVEEKVFMKIEALKNLEEFKNNTLLKSNSKLYKYFLRFIDFLKQKCNEEVEFLDSGNPLLNVEAENRTYDLSQPALTIHAFVENQGTGIAKNICILDDNLPKQQVSEFLPPNKKSKVQFKIILEKDGHIQGNPKTISFKLIWENDRNEKSETIITNFLLKEQKTDLPWEELRKDNPYSIRIVNDPTKLFGREKFIEDLKWNIEESRQILSYVIFGQKRVGKSSIIRTLDTIYSNDPRIIYIYKTIGDVKSLDSISTFQNLSRVLFTRLTQEFRKRNPNLNLELLSSINNFDGSLTGLIEIIDEIKNYSDVRIIFALDEFDELNKEFFENSELGKTFALNIGKGMTDRENVGFILVGSETMEQKTKQGMRLNSFELKKVDTFDRETEFAAYCKIITEPSKTCLKFSDEAIEYMFDYTNGNPYFTNLLSDKVFREAYEKKISFMDIEFVKNIITHQVNKFLSQKDFQHFWDDGLSEEAVNYETVLDRRRRVLTAFAETKNEKGSCTWHDVKKKLKFPTKYKISDNQMEDTLNEFKQRGIIKDTGKGVLQIFPKLFEDWLLGPGIFQVIAQLEDKDEILDLVQQESKLYLTDEELTEIYNYLQEGNKKNGNAILRAFLDQFEDNRSKRLIADLLLKTLVISASETVEFIKKIKKNIWTQPIELSVDERNLRKDTEIFSSTDTIQHNKRYLDIIKSEFKIASNKSIKKIEDFSSLDEGIKNIIFFELVIDCPHYFRNELSKFLKKINPTLVRTIKIHIIAVVISVDAKDEIEKLFADYYAFEFSIHAMKVVQRSDISPYFNNFECINDPTWKLLCKVYKNSTNLSCLIKIGEQIPYQVFPIFWSEKIDKLKPLFSNNSIINFAIHDERFKTSEKLKSLKFESESKILEFKASLVEPSINWKKIQVMAKTLKSIDQDKLQNLEPIRKEIENLWFLKTEDKNKVVKGVKHSIAKTIAAFGNTEGGELFVGIEDDFTITGIAQDIKNLKSKENVLDALDDIVTKYIGKEFSKILHTDFIELEKGIIVFKITVNKCNIDVWVNIDKAGNSIQESPEFFVRQQQETVQLSAKKIIDWKKF